MVIPFEDVVPSAPLHTSVYALGVKHTVGEPHNAPVAESRDRPAGRLGAMLKWNERVGKSCLLQGI